MDLGPGRYFVTSIGGSTDEQTMRYFIMSSPCYSIRLRSCCCSRTSGAVQQANKYPDVVLDDLNEEGGWGTIKTA